MIISIICSFMVCAVLWGTENDEDKAGRLHWKGSSPQRLEGDKDETMEAFKAQGTAEAKARDGECGSCVKEHRLSTVSRGNRSPVHSHRDFALHLALKWENWRFLSRGGNTLLPLLFSAETLLCWVWLERAKLETKPVCDRVPAEAFVAQTRGVG